jgi:SEC-C motif-containing protein
MASPVAGPAASPEAAAAVAPVASLPAKPATKGTIAYAHCCGRFIEAGELPANAEQLMRSRYTAYVFKRFDYLRETWDPATCPADLGSEPGPQWLGLEVQRHQPLDATHALVEFVARYKVAGRAQRMHEVSRFTLGGDGRWRYVDGQVSGHP